MKKAALVALILSCVAATGNAWELRDPQNLGGLPFGDSWFVRSVVDDNARTVTTANLPAVKAEYAASRQAAKNPFSRGGDYMGSSSGQTLIMTTHAEGCRAHAGGSISDAVFVSLAKLDGQHIPVIGGCGYVSNSDPSQIHVRWVAQRDFETVDADVFSEVDIQKVNKSGDIALASAFQLIK